MNVGFHFSPFFRCGDGCYQWMFRCKHHVGGSEKGVRTGREYLESELGIRDCKLQRRASGAPDPVRLLGFGGLGPVDL
ncbi:MAG: hypothetical protein BWY82_02660 [Verrucomicrobia bacterium ADurb.Bin474]|nr:MAG: hypothetical protein BWY82_02660 [Verrucomicrobia bacterium ADurb.Bin474]